MGSLKRAISSKPPTARTITYKESNKEEEEPIRHQGGENMHAHYRKLNDGTHNSSTYHKKDGTAVRAILKREAKKQAEEGRSEPR